MAPPPEPSSRKSSRKSPSSPTGEKVLALTGPTASGKGSLARELAERLDGEIVSVDSMKVYRELDVVTAKPSTALQRKYRYHLVDILEPHEEFSVGDFLERLHGVLGEIASRNRWAILCGGSALYLKAYLEGLQSRTAADWGRRQELLTEAERDGVASLHERLRHLDAEAASRIAPTDLRRLVRAIEVVETTGEPMAAEWRWQSESVPRCAIFGIDWPREELYRRIDVRVERMVEAGLFEEIERLRCRRPALSRSAAQCIGLKETLAGEEEGVSREEVIARVQQSTRRFAKRQLTWFRKFPVQWLDATRLPTATSQADELLAGSLDP